MKKIYKGQGQKERTGTKEDAKMQKIILKMFYQYHYFKASTVLTKLIYNLNPPKTEMPHEKENPASDREFCEKVF